MPPSWWATRNVAPLFTCTLGWPRYTETRPVRAIRLGSSATLRLLEESIAAFQVVEGVRYSGPCYWPVPPIGQTVGEHASHLQGDSRVRLLTFHREGELRTGLLTANGVAEIDGQDFNALLT